MIRLAGLAKPFLQKEAVAQPNTILVTRMDNGNTDMQFPNGQELDSDIYADALEMAEDKYAMGTKIEFIYLQFSQLKTNFTIESSTPTLWSIINDNISENIQ